MMMGKANTNQQFDGFHFRKAILGLHYDLKNAFFASFQYLKYNLWKGMEIQKILALEEVRSFHYGCQVHTCVGSGKKGLKLQPGLDKSMGENTGFVGTEVNRNSVSSDGVAALCVLVIDVVPLYELGLL